MKRVLVAAALLLLASAAAEANHLTPKSFTVFQSSPDACNVRAFEGSHGWTSPRNGNDQVELQRGDGETGYDTYINGFDTTYDTGTDCSGAGTVGEGNAFAAAETDGCCNQNGQEGGVGWVDRGFDLDNYGAFTTDKSKPLFSVTSASLDFNYGASYFSGSDYDSGNSLSYLYAYLEPGDISSGTDITTNGLAGYWFKGRWGVTPGSSKVMLPFWTGSAASKTAAGCTTVTVNGPINFGTDVGNQAGAGSCENGVDTDYSAMWVGFVNIPAGGTWTFYFHSDDGGYVVVDDTKIINDAVDSGCEGENGPSGSISLSAGWHRIQTFYYQNGGGSCARLEWSGPGQGHAVIPAGNLGYSGDYRFAGGQASTTNAAAPDVHGPDYIQVWDPSNNPGSCPNQGLNPVCTIQGKSLTNIYDSNNLAGGGTSQTLAWFFNNIATASRVYRVYFWAWTYLDMTGNCDIIGNCGASARESLWLSVDDARIPVTYNYFGYNIIISQIRISNGTSTIASRTCTATYAAPPMDGTCGATSGAIPDFRAGDYIYYEVTIQHRGDSGDPTSTRPVVAVEWWKSNDGNTVREWRNDTYWDYINNNGVTTNPANGLQCAEGDLNGAGGTPRWGVNTETVDGGGLSPGESLTVLCRIPTSTAYGYNPMPDGYKLDTWIHVRDANVDVDHDGNPGVWWNDAFTQLSGFGADTISIDNAKIDGYNPALQSASWSSGCRYLNGNNCWVRNGDTPNIDATYYDNGTYNGGVTGSDEFFVVLDNAPAASPYDSNHTCYVDVAFGASCTTFTHIADENTLAPQNPTCQTGGGCTGTTVTMRTQVNVINADEQDFDVGFQMYDGLRNGIASMTFPAGLQLRTDNTAPATPTFVSPLAGAWFRRDFTVSATDSDARSGLALCEFQVESSVDGATWRVTKPWASRLCSGSFTVGVWSSGSGEGCQDSGANRCRVTLRATDNVGLVSATVSRTFSIDWDGPFVNISPRSMTWQTANFPVSGSEADQPPGGVASGFDGYPCKLRVVDIPSAGGAWSVRRWGDYACGTNPTVTVGATGQCSSQADNSTAPNWRPTCLVVAGVNDTPDNPSMLYYPLDDNSGTTATDLGPAGVNGSLVGGASYSAENGRFRHGVSLDGVNGAIDVTLPANLTGGPLTNFTVEFWVRPNSGAIANRGLFTFCANPGAACSGGYDRLIYTDVNGFLCFRVWPHDAGGCAAGNPIVAGAWNHIALRVQNGTAASLFRNGTLVRGPITAAGHSEFDYADSMRIGFTNDASNPYFAGTVDEVKVHFRPLNDTEIAWAAQGGEVGGGAHYRVDYTAPSVSLTSPPASAWFRRDFNVAATDSDGQSGLVSCEAQIESQNGSTWKVTQSYQLRTCNANPSFSAGVWSTLLGNDCQDSGPNQCRVTIRATDQVGWVTTAAVRTFSIDWDGPFVNISSPPSQSWQTADFALVHNETDQPPGGVASGFDGFPCTIRVARIPSAGGAWTLTRWGTYACGTDPSAVTVGSAPAQCSDQADNSTWPYHRATCLVVTGAKDTPDNPSMLYYPLDDNSGTTATDLGPAGINGTLYGGASFASDGGYLRHGVSLSGAQQSINVTLPANLTGGPLTNFTVEFWVRPNSGAVANRGLFSFCDPDATCATRDREIYTDASGNLCFRILPNDPGGCGTTPLTTNWNHLALVVQNATTATLYRNGTTIARGPVPLGNHSEFDTATSMHIGHSLATSNPFLAGTVDEVKVHFRPLNASEIAWAAQSGVPGPTSNDSEPGGAKHVRIDYTAPTTTWNNPGQGSEQTNDFTIDISDSDAQSGLNKCEYRLQQPLDPNPNNNIIRDWTARTCNSATSALIPVGGGASECQDANPDPDIGTPCRVYVRSWDNAGLVSAAVSRDFVINYLAPLLRIEAPTNLKTVGLYTNASETCTGTVSGCQNWWYARLRERGFIVANLSWSDLNISNGLRSQGYSNDDLTGTSCGPVVTPNVNYGNDVGTQIFGGGTPCGGDTYSIMWKGYVYVPTTAADWFFGMVYNDRVRLFIDNTLVLNNWTNGSCATPAPGNETSALTLSQGYHAIKIQYAAEQSGATCARLYWRSATAGIGFGTTVPPNRLFATKTPSYLAVVNPYGEVFPGTDGPSPNPETINIRDYAAGGNTWLESGGFSIFYPWSGGATGSAANSQAVCADILNNGNQVVNRTRNASNATAFHNSPSNFSNESSAPDRPSLGMFGGCGSAQKFRGLYVNSTGQRYGPALHCYGTGCVARTDNTAPGRWEAVPWNWSFGAPEAVRLRFTTGGVPTGTDSSLYRVINSSLTYPVASGDRLQFDVWLDSTNNSIGGGFDAVFSVSGAFRLTALTDQNGLSADTAASTWTPNARGRWYHRTFDLSSKAGETLSSFRVGYDSVGTNAVPAGTYEVLLGNVVITDSTGRVKQVVQREGTINNASVAGSPTADVTSFTALTVAYAGATPNVYADVLRHWVNQNWTIMVEDDDDSPTPLSCTSQVRSAGVITVPNWTRPCDNDLNITVGPNLNCRDEGDDKCELDINTTNDTSGTFRAPKFGIDWTPPTTSRDMSKTTPCAYRANSSWVYYSSNSSSTYCPPGGTVTVTSGAADATSGVAYVAFPNTTSDGGITIWPGPHTWTYAFGSASFFNGTATLYVNDNASNVNSTQFTVYLDTKIPSGDTGPSYYDGYYGSLGVPMTLPAVSDAESGVANFSTGTNPPLGRFLLRRDTALGNGACNGFAANWTYVADDSTAGFPPPAGGAYNDTTVAQATCYQYSYNVSDNVANWANATFGSIAKIDITPPDYCGPLSIIANNSYGYVSGTTVYYNGNYSGGFNVTVAFASDPESGIANVTFPTTTSVGGAKSPPGSGPPYNWSYNWTSSATFNASTNATCYNNASVGNNTSFVVLNDKYPPTGNTGPIYTDGFYPQQNVSITIPSGISDNMSGVAASGSGLFRRSTLLWGGVCNGFSNNWTIVAYPIPGSTFYDTTVDDGTCNQYSYNISDNVWNWANATPTCVGSIGGGNICTAAIDTSPPQSAYIDQPPGNFGNPPITPINYDTGTDPESGIGNWYIQRSNASLNCAGAPLGWSAFGNLTAPGFYGFGPSSGSLSDSLNLIPSTAYRYQLVVENLAGRAANFTDLSGDISYYKRNVDPNITKQLVVYEWSATYTGAPVDRWAFHNTSQAANDGFTVTQTSTSIEVWRNGTTTFSAPAASGETHAYKVAYDYSCDGQNYIYLYRDGLYVGRVGGSALATGDVVRHVASVNTQTNWFISAPGRWDPPLNFDSASTAANGCTNYVLDSCRISGARPCTGSRAVQTVQVLDATVYRPGTLVNISASFACTGTTDFGVSYNPGNGSGWYTQNSASWFRNDQASCVTLFPQVQNGGNPGIHRVRASIRDGAEGSAPFTCGTWDGDNDDVAFWVAEPVRG